MSLSATAAAAYFERVVRAAFPVSTFQRSVFAFLPLLPSACSTPPTHPPTRPLHKSTTTAATAQSLCCSLSLSCAVSLVVSRSCPFRSLFVLAALLRCVSPRSRCVSVCRAVSISLLAVHSSLHEQRVVCLLSGAPCRRSLAAAHRRSVGAVRLTGQRGPDSSDSSGCGSGSRRSSISPATCRSWHQRTTALCFLFSRRCSAPCRLPGPPSAHSPHPPRSAHPACHWPLCSTCAHQRHQRALLRSTSRHCHRQL